MVSFLGMKAEEVIALFSKSQFIARHGDVVIVADPTVQPDSQADCHGVVAEGEATGHAHRVNHAEVRRVVGDLIQRTITAKQPTHIDHEEHQLSPIPQGEHRTSILAQWTPEGLSRVAD